MQNQYQESFQELQMMEETQDSNEELKCFKCKRVRDKKTSNSEKNPGREFLTCPNGCKYSFCWVDELHLENQKRVDAFKDYNKKRKLESNNNNNNNYNPFSQQSRFVFGELDKSDNNPPKSFNKAVGSTITQFDDKPKLPAYLVKDDIKKLEQLIYANNGELSEQIGNLLNRINFISGQLQSLETKLQHF